jgi:flavin-binding protein dodecin
MRPLRVSRSTSVAAALCAIIRRIADGEPIRVAEIVNSNGKVVKTVLVHYRKIEIK